MIERTTDAAKVNAVVNFPAIRPFIGNVSAGDLDLAPLLDCARNVCLFGEHGGFLYHWCAPGVFEVHTFVMPDGRGAWARESAKASLTIMRDDYAADMVWTRVAPDMPHVHRFALEAGFVDSGSDDFDIGGDLVTYNLLTWRP